MNALSLIFYKSVGIVTDSSQSKVSLEPNILDKKQYRKLRPLSGFCDVIACSCRDAAAI